VVRKIEIEVISDMKKESYTLKEVNHTGTGETHCLSSKILRSLLNDTTIESKECYFFMGLISDKFDCDLSDVKIKFFDCKVKHRWGLV